MSWINDVQRINPFPPALEIPDRFVDATIQQIPDGALRKATVDYCKAFRQVAPLGVGCLFVGQAEQWKTYAACAIAKLVNQKVHLDVLFIQCPVVIAQWERNRYSEDTNIAITKAGRASLLIMDDFAQTNPSSYRSEVLMEIAETRFANLHPTLWTGNVAGVNIQQSIAGLYGPGFARRLWSGSEGFRVKV